MSADPIVPQPMLPEAPAKSTMRSYDAPRGSERAREKKNYAKKKQSAPFRTFGTKKKPSNNRLQMELLLVFLIGVCFCTQHYYLRSDVGQPWGVSTNEEALDAILGTGNWIDARYETVNTAAMFSAARFIFMEGGDSNADEMNTFLTANTAAISAWVNVGGVLFLNAAPNEGGNIDFGFGVTLQNPSSTADVEAFDVNHPIFLGPFTPVGTQFSGGSFGHAVVVGPLDPIIVDSSDASKVVFGTLAVGSGFVACGGMTTNNFHSPQPNADNLRRNIIYYLLHREDCTDGVDNNGDGAIDCLDPSCCGVSPCTYPNAICPEICNDNIDNDGSNGSDCLDPNCIGSASCPESKNCGDGVDNDGDSLIDCLDVDCSCNTVNCPASVCQLLYALGATSPSGQPMNLFTIERATGATTLIGSTGEARLRGLAMHPSTGRLYSCSTGDINGVSGGLYEVDRQTGAATYVGGMGLFVSLAFSPADGTLFGLGFPGGGPQGTAISTIDVATGAFVPFVDIGGFGNTGMTVTADGRRILLSASSSSLRSIDIATRTSSVVTSFSGGSAQQLAVSPRDGSMVGTETPQNGDDFYVVDQVTGQHTKIGNTNNRMRGLTFDSEIVCNDGIDNDGDGAIDCLDSSCCGRTPCGFSAICLELCNDGLDNDVDGLKDCRDPNCVGSALCPESKNCEDGVDNDGEFFFF
jgi:hypothetical protein